MDPVKQKVKKRFLSSDKLTQFYRVYFVIINETILKKLLKSTDAALNALY